MTSDTASWSVFQTDPLAVIDNSLLSLSRSDFSHTPLEWEQCFLPPRVPYATTDKVAGISASLPAAFHRLHSAAGGGGAHGRVSHFADGAHHRSSVESQNARPF